MIRTHAFKLGKYHINLCGGLDGCADTPDNTKWKDSRHDMYVLDGSDIRSLHCQLHEAMHADGYPDSLLHDKEGFPDTWKLARFLWRLGWRRT